MPTYSITAPNGKTYRMTGPAGLSQDALINHVMSFDPAAGTPPPPRQTGVGAAFKSGLENLLSSGAAGIKGLYDPEGAAADALAAQQEQERKYDPGVSMQRVAEAYNAPEGGIMAAGKELVGQIPRAIAQSAPEMATAAAGAKLGSMAGSVFGPAGTVVGGVGGAILGGILPMTGRNLAEQQEQTPGQISYGKAAAAGAGQAALESVTPLALMGGRVASKIFGKDMAAITARLGPEAAEEVAKRRLLATVARSGGVGAVGEAGTEALQEAIGRLQSGQDLLGEEALKSYAEAAYGGALAGGALGGAGGVYDRMGAQQTVADKRRAAETLAAQRAAEEQEAARVAEEQAIAERRARPEYANDIAIAYDAYEAQKKALLGRRAAMKSEGTDAGRQAYKTLGDELAEFTKAHQPLIDEYNATRGAREATAVEAAQRAAADAAAGVPPAPAGALFGGYENNEQQNRVSALTAQIDELEAFAPRADEQMVVILRSGDPAQIRQARAGEKQRGETLKAAWAELDKLDPSVRQRREQEAAEHDRAQAALAIDPEQAQKQIDALTAKLQSVNDPSEAAKAQKWATQRAQLQSLLDERTKQQAAVAAPESPYAEDLFQLGTRLERAAAKSERRQAGQQAALEAAGRGEMTREVPNLDLGAQDVPGTPYVDTPEGMARETDAAAKRAFPAEPAPGMFSSLLTSRETEAMQDVADEDTGENVGLPRKLPGRPGTAPVRPDLRGDASGQSLLFKPEAGPATSLVDTLRQRIAGVLARPRLTPQAKATLQRATDVLDAPTVPQRVLDNISEMVGRAERGVGATVEEGRPKVRMQQGMARVVTRPAAQALETEAVGSPGRDESAQPELPGMGGALYAGRATPANFQRALDTGALPSKRGEKTAKRHVEGLLTAGALLRHKAAGIKSRIADAAAARKRLDAVVSSLRQHTPEQRKALADTAHAGMADATEAALKAKDIAAKHAKAAAELEELAAGATEGEVGGAREKYVRQARKAQMAEQEALRQAGRVEDYKLLRRLVTEADAAPAMEAAAGRHDALVAELADVEKQIAANDADLKTRQGEVQRKQQKAAGEVAAPNVERTEARYLPTKKPPVKARVPTEAERRTTATGTGPAEYAERTGQTVTQVAARQGEPGVADLGRAVDDAVDNALAVPGVKKEALQRVFARVQRQVEPRALGKMTKAVDKQLKGTADTMRRFLAANRDGVVPARLRGDYNGAVLAREAAEQKLKSTKGADARAAVMAEMDRIDGRIRVIDVQRTPLEDSPEYGMLRRQLALKQFEGDIIELQRTALRESGGHTPLQQREVLGRPEPGEVEPATRMGDQKPATRMAVAKQTKPQKTVFQGKGNRKTALPVTEGVRPASAMDTLRAMQEAAAKRAGVTLDDITVPKVISDLYDSIEATPLTAENLQHAHDGQLDKILDSLAKTGSTPAVREWAEKLGAFTKNTRLVVTEKVGKGGEAAVYDPAADTIRIHPLALTEENLQHEVVHAATLRALVAPADTLTREQRNARQGLQGLLERLQADPAFKRDYGQKDLAELASEVVTNPALREKIDAQKPGLLRRLLNAIKQMLGLKSDSTRALADVERLLQPAMKFTPEQMKALNSMLGTAAVPTAARVPTGPMGELGAMITAAPKAKGVAGAKALIRDSNAGLSAEMALVDQRAPILQALSKGTQQAYQQAQYYLRKADARMSQVYSVLQHGPAQLKKDAKGNHIIEAGNGPSAKQLFEQIGKLPGDDAAQKFATAQAYMVAQRAANKGWDKLGFDTAPALRAAAERDLAQVNADPALKAKLEGIRETYNKYNAGMVQFLADSGAISKDTAKKLLADGDYVPFYRLDTGSGVAELVMGEGTHIAVGDIRKQPHLQQLKGDSNTKLMPLNEAIMRNTMLLTDMGLSNLTTKDIAYALQNMSPKGTNSIRSGNAPAGADIVKFKQNGEDRWMRVQSEGTPFEGIPAEMLVQSLEGTHTVLTGMGKVGQWFGDLLRKGVTRNPAYVLRQLIRDPMSAAFTAGTSRGVLRATMQSMREFVAQSRGGTETGDALLKKGVTQSGIFSGDADDLALFAQQLAQGKQGKLEQLLSMADRAAMRADAATRSQVYEDALKATGSEMQAELAAIEMMNFTKRGSSPTVQHAARMVPFLNAQIQALNVLAKAMRGNMPAEEALQIKQKFYNRAMGLAAFSFVYALGMEENEEYKKASADERYNNFFIPTPGATIKVPIPYEVGLLFKALPEAAAHAATRGLSDADKKALGVSLMHSIPGASAGFVMPQGVKPALELAMNKRMYDMSPIETEQQRELAPSQRYGENTTELVKWISSNLPEGLGASPVRIEHALSGYFGGVPVAVASLANDMLSGKTSPERKLTQTPVIGKFFADPHSTKGTTEDVYNAANEAREAEATYKHLVDSGQYEEAQAYLKENKDVLAKKAIGETARKFMSEMRAQRKQIAGNPNLSAAEKRKQIDKLDNFINEQGAAFRKVLQAPVPAN